MLLMKSTDTTYLSEITRIPTLRQPPLPDLHQKAGRVPWPGGSVSWASSHELKGCQFDSSSGYMAGS